MTNQNAKKILVSSALYNWSETQRMIYISKILHKNGFEIFFLGTGKYEYLLKGLPFQRVKIEYDEIWFSSNRINMLYQMEEFGNNYASLDEIKILIKNEVNLLKRIKPNLIITGYRPSLTISSKIVKIPIVWCLSAVLSKNFLLNRIDKSLNILNKTDAKCIDYFNLRNHYENIVACNRILKNNKTSFNWNLVLRSFKCEELKSDFDMFVGDLNLMSDCDFLFDKSIENRTYKFIGPIFNDEKIKISKKVLSILNSSKIKILISIGSSSNKEKMICILDSLKHFNYLFLISNIGVLNKEEQKKYPPNFIFCEKFPLIEIMNKCNLSIIHGGQGTLYSCLYAGCPFIGLPYSLEQKLNIENILDQYECGKILYKQQKYSILPRLIQEVLKSKKYALESSRIKKRIESEINKTSSSFKAYEIIEKFIGEHIYE